MYIEYIYMEDFLLFPKYNGTVLEKTFSSNVILVEGINGAGKSSLFGELTPLPADKTKYGKKGYKLLRIRHKGSLYEIINDFRNGVKYSFTIDGGENLNTAGIITTQRELVFAHFGITKISHDVRVGREKFTKMSPNTRKKIFNARTNLNIDHVLRGYSEVNEKNNLCKLMLKTETGLLKTEESRLISKEEAEILQKELDESNKLIDELLLLRGGLVQFVNPERTEEAFFHLQDLIKEKRSFLEKNYYVLTKGTSESYSELRDKLIGKLHELDTENKFIFNEIGEKEELIKTMEFNPVKEGESLDNTITSLKSEIFGLSKNLKDFHPLNDTFKEECHLYFSIRDVVDTVVPDMERNPIVDGVYLFNKKTKEEFSTRLDQVMTELSHRHVMRQNLEENKDIFSQAHGSVECPSCHLSLELKGLFSAENNQVKLGIINKAIDELMIERDQLTIYIDRANAYFKAYVDINNVRKKCGEHFKTFWESVDSSELLTKEPALLKTMLIALTSDYHDASKIAELTAMCKQAEDQKNWLSNLKGKSLDELKVEIFELANKAQSIRQKREVYRIKLIDLEREKDIREKFEDHCKVMETIKDQVREYNLSCLTGDFLNVIDEEIRKVRLLSVEKSNIIRSQSNIQYILGQINAKIKDIEEDISIYTEVLEVLSPKSGLIAKNLSNFLNTIINFINGTLTRVWSYKMVLDPIDVSKDILNYKFKLTVEDSLKVPDISFASTGMQEIINLSYVLVDYKLSGNEDHPLFLDELASGMDTYHTEQMRKLTHSFAMESSFSQVFIATHKENMNFLKDCDIIELS